MSCATVFGGTGFVGRRLVRYLHEVGTKVRIVSRHQGRAEDDGIEQIAADARDERCVEAAPAGADGAVNAMSSSISEAFDPRCKRSLPLSIHTARVTARRLPPSIDCRCGRAVIEEIGPP